MKNRHSCGSRMCASIVALALGGLVGCESQDQVAQDQGRGSEESLTVALTSVPASTLCIRVTAKPSSGSAATVKSFIVTPGSSSANLQMGVLLPETYGLTADAFNVACSSVNGAGNWIADPVTVTVRPGVAETVTMTFRKNSPLGVKANFVSNVRSFASGYSASYVVTDTDILATGYVYPNYGVTFAPVGFSAFDSTSVPGNAVVTLVPTKFGACVLRADGTVWCWGYNYHGELGLPPNPANPFVNTPVQVTGISNAKLIAAGEYHVCVGDSNGQVRCWGQNTSGQLGDGTLNDSSSPVLVPSLYGASFLAAGSFSTYMLDGDGTLYSWGENQFGQLGDGTGTDRPSPVSVDLPAPPLSISAGQDHACILSAGGAVFCWGYNGWGQLGDGTTTNRLSPTPVVGLSAKQVVSGVAHSCALTVGNQTVCWGQNSYGYSLGNRTSTDSSIPTPVALDGVTLTSLSSFNAYNTCGLSTSLELYCWGANLQGQLGNGTKTSSSFPVRAQLQ
jgi:hypothetical protein